MNEPDREFEEAYAEFIDKEMKEAMDFGKAVGMAKEQAAEGVPAAVAQVAKEEFVPMTLEEFIEQWRPGVSYLSLVCWPKGWRGWPKSAGG